MGGVKNLYYNHYFFMFYTCHQGGHQWMKIEFIRFQNWVSAYTES